MRKLYVPIMMDPEHNVGTYHEDFQKLGVDHVFLAETLRLNHVRGERYGMEMENIRNALTTYTALGYECGVWINTLGFGGPLFSTADEVEPFTQIRSVTGRELGDAICPTDVRFTERMCEIVRDLAKVGAKMIMLDDELCLSVRPGLGCACDRHLAEFARRVGENIPLSEIPKKVFTGKGNKYRKEWLKMQGDTLRAFCKSLRDALDGVDATVRMGFCAGYTAWDVEGVDAIELTRILAGNTKPFLRFTSAPYWHHAQRFGQTPLATFIEFARMQAAWTENEDIEVFTECDTYPHDRFHTPLSHIQCFDAATMLTEGVGVLKYFYHYPCTPETERGYIDAHLASVDDCKAMQDAFYGKQEVGVRVYERMHKLADATLPSSLHVEKSQKWIMKKYAFSESQMMLSVNAIPTVYSGTGVCGIAFGENANGLPSDALQNGLILDITAAEILMKQGIDVGLRSVSPLSMTVLEDFFDGKPVSVFYATDLCDIQIDERATVVSSFVDTDHLSSPRQRMPAAYLYENGQGQRFLVYAFRAENQPEYSGMYWNYRRGAQIAGAIPWLSGKSLPVTSCGHPYGYCRCNEDERSVSYAYFNCTSDGIDRLECKFSRDVQNVKIIGGCGEQTDARTVILRDVRGYGYVCMTAEYLAD